MNTNNARAIDVANYILSIANRDGDLISNLKLQKLLYYAQAWYLVNYNVPLFNERIEAWELGPVVREVYSHFKRFKSSPITYTVTGEESNCFTNKQVNYLNEFYDVFSKYTAHELVNMTHNEAPWKEAFEAGYNISEKTMKEYYSAVLKSKKNAQKH